MRDRNGRQDLTRREALAGVAAGVAVAGLPAAADAADARRRKPSRPARKHGRGSRRVDVCIVGGGISGLTAARRLVQAGVRSVLVLEANDRVGGRTLNLSVVPGVITEGGGEWVGPGQDRVSALVSELGLSTFKTYVTGSTTYVRGGQKARYSGTIPPFSAGALADFAQAQLQLQNMAATVDPAAPWTASSADKWDGTTFGQWLDANMLTDEARYAMTLTFSLINGEDPHNTSLLFVLFRIANSGGSLDPMINTSGGAQDSRIVGGSQQLSLRMAAALRPRVILSSPVTNMTRTSSAVLVQSERVDVRCRRVIVAMTPADANRIRFEPELPTRRAMLHRTWHQGTGTKIALVYPKPWWRNQGLNGQAVTDIPTAAYTVDNSPPDGRLGIMITFIGTAGGGPGLAYSDTVLDDPAARRQAVIGSLTTVFGDQVANPIQYLEKDWIHEPWIAGCESTRAPGLITETRDALTQPVGRIHWAGTETADKWEGYMDGAIRAGERTAAEVRGAI